MLPFPPSQVKMMVVLGELGGKDEYSLVEALKEGKVNKPVVAWVSGTCARLFKSEVQFGHAVSQPLPKKGDPRLHDVIMFSFFSPFLS